MRLLAAFTIVSLLFAFFYHKGVQITEPFNFDNLPPVPKRTQEITKWECIADIVFCVLFKDENAIVINLFSNLQLFIMIIMLFALMLDSVDVIVKTLRK